MRSFMVAKKREDSLKQQKPTLQQEVGKFIFTLLKTLGQQSENVEDPMRTIKGLATLMAKQKQQRRYLLDNQQKVWEIFEKAKNNWFPLKAYYYGLECKLYSDSENEDRFLIGYTAGRQSTLFTPFPLNDQTKEIMNEKGQLSAWLDKQVSGIITFLDSYDTEDIANEDEEVNLLASELAALVDKSDKKPESKPQEETKADAEEATQELDSDSRKQDKSEREPKSTFPPASGVTRNLKRKRVGA